MSHYAYHCCISQPTYQNPSHQRVNCGNMVLMPLDSCCRCCPYHSCPQPQPNASACVPTKLACQPCDCEQFQMNLDVQQFMPEEISVRVTGNCELTVEGCHEEREDEHGYISRHFVRRYVLPKGLDIGRIETRLSTDGILTIMIPKANNIVYFQDLPIKLTGQNSRSGGCSC